MISHESRSVLIAVSFAAGLCVHTFARRSDACSAIGQGGWIYAGPANGSTVPANLPAIAAGHRFGLSSLNLTGISVVRADSKAPVAGTLQGTEPIYLRFSGALVVGAAYEVTWSHADASAPFTPPTVTFSAGAQSPFPTDAGTFKTTVSQGYVDMKWGTGCRGGADAAFATLAPSLSAEMTPWLDATQLVTRVDGAEWKRSDVGIRNYVVRIHFREPLVVYAACPWARETDPVAPRLGEYALDRGLSEGTHEIELLAEIAGRPALSLGKSTVDLRCAAPEGGVLDVDAADGAAVDVDAADGAAVDGRASSDGDTEDAGRPDGGAGGDGSVPDGAFGADAAVGTDGAVLEASVATGEDAKRDVATAVFDATSDTAAPRVESPNAAGGAVAEESSSGGCSVSGGGARPSRLLLFAMFAAVGLGAARRRNGRAIAGRSG
jgi:MYXO-CTERM domain-containing protein